jgi:hypothetical protein
MNEIAAAVLTVGFIGICYLSSWVLGQDNINSAFQGLTLYLLILINIKLTK